MVQHSEYSQLEAVARRIDPRAKLLRAWQLKGGISARMDALEVQGGDGPARKLIVRRPGARAIQHNPDAAADEFRILQIVQSVGVKSQTPYLLDMSGEIFPDPYLVLEYIEGAPDYAPTDVTRAVTQIATQLATLHRADGASPELAPLPRHAERMADKLHAPPATLDHALNEGAIRKALARVWPLPAPPQLTLLHGDFWPGNLLWDQGELVAIIDWEDAAVGNALADFATTRLDVLWIFGMDALHTFTARYCALAPCDLRQLPAWDLWAALRPAGQLAVWAEGWAELGRPDITVATMQAAHRWFVDQALGKLKNE